LGEATTFPVILFFVLLHEAHPNGILSRDSQVGVPEFRQLGPLQHWGPITLRVDLWLQWGLKQSCSPRWELFNDMSHATYTRGDRVNSRLLVVGSQTVNLIFDLSFGHNLCFRCSNGSKPILNIFVSISFQWYKEPFEPMGFTPAIALWKFGSPLGFQLPKGEFTWECEGSFPHTLLHSREHKMWLPGFPLGPQPYKPLPWSWA
jgi:hypothetical protein